jgi:hypothetical protein
MTRLVIAIFFICGFVCCENYDKQDYYILVQNNTKDTLQCYFSYNYPDISLSSDKPLLETIKPTSFAIIYSKDSWDKVLPNDKLIINIISKDTIDRYQWSEIKAKDKILKRYLLSKADINRLQNKVTYP